MHVSKARQSDSDDAAARGASANRDDCRAFFSMTEISEKEARDFGISNPKLFVKIESTKNNYAARPPEPLILQRCTDAPGTPEDQTIGGVLVAFDAKGQAREVAGTLLDRVAKLAAELIGQNSDSLSVRDWGNGTPGSVFRATIKDAYPNATKAIVKEGLRHAVSVGLLAVEQVAVKGVLADVPRQAAARGLGLAAGAA